MAHRIEVGFKKGITDVLGDSVKKDIVSFLRVPVSEVKTRNIYLIDSDLSFEDLEFARKELFTDPVIQESVTDSSLMSDRFDWSILVGFKPGVTDNVGRTSKRALEDILNRKFSDDESVYTSVQYLISGPVNVKDVNLIATGLLANSVIEDVKVQSYDEWFAEGLGVKPPKVLGEQRIVVNEYNLMVSDEELARISSEGVLALDLKEMQAIRDYFSKPAIFEERKKFGLSKNPTDVELESLAQTWSEHCKHKIFNALIHYTDEEGNVQHIDSLFDTYIKKSTEEAVASGIDWLLSVFEDNAGVIKFNDRLSLVYKVETHNSPSALEPYGGALTGIVGVNRDPFGTGRGSRLLVNVWGFCFGDPHQREAMPAGLLHPKRIRDGVHKGVIDGGNQSGIPYGRGWEIFDWRYSGKPLVFCGTLGIMPNKIRGKLSYKKKANPNDLVVMVGGRIGKDGIHGATFSSEEIHEGSPVQAVQIGDPITQKKMSDFLLEARDLGLYNCITDNGAGGLSSSVGEMARFSNGAEIDLEKCPLKYAGCQPWEILVSEAQERMTLSVPPSRIKKFLKLAERRDVEATVLGRFTDSGKFHVKYGDKTVAYLGMDFLHDGNPRYELTAAWKKPVFEEPCFAEPGDLTNTLKGMLSRLNICSGEEKCRQYDHEVKGRTVVKPFVGKDFDVPSDATVFLAELGSLEGIILAEGVSPFFSDIDTYHMAASAVDEAVRKVISVGGKLGYIAALDNFCWCDSLKSEKNPDGDYKLAQLVRANQGLYDYVRAFNAPLISGKDSMFNDCAKVTPKISVPRTLLVSVISKLGDVSKAVTMDVKQPGDLVYVLGETFNELGASEYYRFIGEKEKCEAYIGNNVPKVDAERAISLYSALARATDKGLVHSIHTPTRAGLGVAFAKTAFAGGYGLDIYLKNVPQQGVERSDTLFFSESNSRFVVTLPERNKEEFENLMQGNAYACVGYVRPDKEFNIIGLRGMLVVHSDVETLKECWQKTLRGA